MEKRCGVKQLWCLQYGVHGYFSEEHFCMSHREDGTPKCSSCQRYTPRQAPHTNASTIRLPLTITGCKSDTFRPCGCPMMGILSHCLKCELFAELPVVSICMSPFEPSQSCLG